MGGRGVECGEDGRSLKAVSSVYIELMSELEGLLLQPAEEKPLSGGGRQWCKNVDIN